MECIGGRRYHRDHPVPVTLCHCPAWRWSQVKGQELYRTLTLARVKDVTSELPHVSVCLCISSMKTTQCYWKTPMQRLLPVAILSTVPNSSAFFSFSDEQHLILLTLTPHAGGVCPWKGVLFFSSDCRTQERFGMPEGMLLTGRARVGAKIQRKVKMMERSSEQQGVYF